MYWVAVPVSMEKSSTLSEGRYWRSGVWMARRTPFWRSQDSLPASMGLRVRRLTCQQRMASAWPRSIRARRRSKPGRWPGALADLLSADLRDDLQAARLGELGHDAALVVNALDLALLALAGSGLLAHS